MTEGSTLPGPRDDFAFVSPANAASEGYLSPMYLIGGFKDGMKMNDIYRLKCFGGLNFIWEEIKI